MFIPSCSLNTNKQKELFVIHIHGDWCKTCNKVDPVVHSLDNYWKNKSGVTYLIFDQTNPESLERSKKEAEKFGLNNIFEYERHTGELLFVDKKTKKVIGNFCGVADKEKYIEATEKLLKGEQITSIEKEPKKYTLSKPEVEKIKEAKLYVIDIHHDKCSTCTITAPIFEEVAEEFKTNKNISFFTFDLSTPNTINETRQLASALGLHDIYNSYKHTGEVLFVNAKLKKVQDSLVAETNKEKYYRIIKKLE